MPGTRHPTKIISRVLIFSISRLSKDVKKMKWGSLRRSVNKFCPFKSVTIKIKIKVTDVYFLPKSSAKHLEIFALSSYNWSWDKLPNSEVDFESSWELQNTIHFNIIKRLCLCQSVLRDVISYVSWFNKYNSSNLERRSTEE